MFSRPLIFTLGTTIAAAIVLFSVSFFYRERIPQATLRRLQEMGITVTPTAAKWDPWRLTLRIDGASFNIRSHSVRGKAERLEVALRMHWGWQPILVSIRMTRPVIDSRSERTPSSATTFSVQLPRLVALKIAVDSLQCDQWLGSGSLILSRSKSVDRNTPALDGEMSLLLTDQRFGLEAYLESAVVWRAHRLQMLQGRAWIGPWILNATANADFAERTWKVDLKLPESVLERADGVKNPRLTTIRKQSGKVRLDFTAGGTFHDLSMLRLSTTGEALLFSVVSPSIEGEVSGDFSVDAEYAGSLQLKSRVALQLQKASIRWQDRFHKPTGVVLNAQAELVGGKDRFTLTTGHLKFHNFELNSNGEFGGRHTDSGVQFRISPTQLEGWEKFFPLYSEEHMGGYLEATGSVSGQLTDLLNAKWNVDTKFSNLRIPAVLSWLDPQGKIVSDGILYLHSISRLSANHGSLKELTTDSLIDFEKSHLRWGKWIEKPAGVRARVDLQTDTASSGIRIKKGEVQFGDLRALLKGKLGDFDLSIKRQELQGIEKLLSEDAKVALSELAGKVSGRTHVKGGIHSQSMFSIEHASARIGSKIPLHVRDVSGDVSYIDRRWKGRSLNVALGNTRSSLSFDVDENLNGKIDGKGTIWDPRDFVWMTGLPFALHGRLNFRSTSHLGFSLSDFETNYRVDGAGWELKKGTAKLGGGNVLFEAQAAKNEPDSVQVKVTITDARPSQLFKNLAKIDWIDGGKLNTTFGLLDKKGDLTIDGEGSLIDSSLRLPLRKILEGGKGKTQKEPWSSITSNYHFESGGGQLLNLRLTSPRITLHAPEISIKNGKLRGELTPSKSKKHLILSGPLESIMLNLDD